MADLINPRLFTSLPEFVYPARCTIQAATETPGPTGQMVPTWADLVGHVNIPARVSPATGSERKAQNQIYTTATHVIALAGYYPAITSKHRAVVSGQVYDILLPQKDGNDLVTELICEVVK